MTLARPPFSLLDVTDNESDTAQHSTHEFLAFLLRRTSSKIPGSFLSVWLIIYSCHHQNMQIARRRKTSLAVP
jgi:hypothetical protein